METLRCSDRLECRYIECGVNTKDEVIHAALLPPDLNGCVNRNWQLQQTGTIFGAWATEPVNKFPWQAAREPSCKVDVWLAPRTGADIYLPPWQLHEPLMEMNYLFDLNQSTNPFYPIPFEQKESSAVFLADACIGERVRVVQSLQSKVAIHSSGACLHNTGPDPEITAAATKLCPTDRFQRKFAAKALLIRKHLFYLAFENSIEDGWITEKFFTAFVVGSIPVYFGTPLARQYEPYPNSILYADAYKTVDELGDAMLRIAGNRTAYESMVSWRSRKRHEWNPKFLEMMNMTRYDAPCRFCQMVHDMHGQPRTPRPRMNTLQGNIVPC